MKAATILFLLATTAVPARADEPVQIQIKATYEALDPARLSDLGEGVLKEFRRDDGVLKMPTLTLRPKTTGKMEVIREMISKVGDDKFEVVPCGAQLEITAKLADGKITLTGTSLLRNSKAPEEGKPGGKLTFSTLSTPIKKTVVSGGSAMIQLNEAGERRECLVIKATLVKPEAGVPIK